jgi:Mn-dependent DtxR family transcriptional regulator
MNDKVTEQESFRALQLMSELEGDDTVSQRELASRLGIAVGLVNSYLKNFVNKGYVRVKNYPRNRYAYLLTAKGFVEKGRLAFQHLDYFTGLYTTTRREYLELFHRIKSLEGREVVFCGVDEVAEIAYLSLQEAGLTLAVVVDEENGRCELLGHQILPLLEAVRASQPVVVTSLKRRDHLVNELMRLGVKADSVHVVGQ